MSKYKPLYSNLWNDPDFEKYTPQEKLIYIFLITNQAVEKSGIYKITIKQISFYTDCNKSIINDFINKLINDNKIKYDFEKGVIFIKNVFKFQKGMIKNKKIMFISLLKNYQMVKTDFWQEFFDLYINDEVINEFINDAINKEVADFIINKKQDKPKKPKEDKKEECKSELPDFINPEIFKDFKNMRKKMKKEMTERAEKMIIKKLKGFEELTSCDANIALEQSILKNYTDVYEPKASTTKTTGIDFKKLNLSNREQHTADLINKMINATLINRISIKNSNLACFHTTKENKEKLNNLPEDQKQEIRKIVKDSFGIKEIEYIY